MPKRCAGVGALSGHLFQLARVVLAELGVVGNPAATGKANDEGIPKGADSMSMEGHSVDQAANQGWSPAVRRKL